MTIKEVAVSSHAITQSQEIHATFKRGLVCLESAGENQSLLGQALLSFHGALEDYFRFFLSNNLALPAETREVVHDRGKTQGRDLVILAQKCNLINANDKNIILSMNKQRQEIAHGKACALHKKEIVYYATFIRSIIGYAEPIVCDSVGSPSRSSMAPRRSTSGQATRDRSSKSGYPLAIGIAAVVLIVMVVGVVFMFIQPVNRNTLPSLVTITSTMKPDCVIKGNISASTGSKQYHLPGMENYNATVIDPE